MCTLSILILVYYTVYYNLFDLFFHCTCWFFFSVVTNTLFIVLVVFFLFKQKTAYVMRISDWSSDVCSSDLLAPWRAVQRDDVPGRGGAHLEQALRLVLQVFRPGQIAQLGLQHADGLALLQQGAVQLDQFVLAALHGIGQLVDRKSVASGQSVPVSVDLGGGWIIKKKT